MATVRERFRKDGSKVFQVQIRLRGQKPTTMTFKRKTDAQKWIQNTESAIREGRYFKKSESRRHTVRELIDRYIEVELPHKPKMKKEYTGQLVWWREQIGHILLSDLTSPVIVQCRESLSRVITNRGMFMSNARVNRYLAALSSALTTAMNEWHWLEENPVKKVKRLKEPKERVRYLDEAEREKLLKACQNSNNEDLYLACVLALSTGARRMEIWSLKWRDIDLNKGILIFEKTKNGHRRSVPVSGHALSLLKLKSKKRKHDSSLVFPSSVDPSRPFDFRRPFTKALKQAEIENFRWHDLRHSAASYMVQSGISLRIVGEILGHRDLSVTQRYAHLSPEHLRESISIIDEKMFG